MATSFDQYPAGNNVFGSRAGQEKRLALLQREAHAFGCWLSEKRQIDDISELMLERYLADLSSQEETLSPQRRQRITTAIRLLLKHSRQAGVIVMRGE